MTTKATLRSIARLLLVIGGIILILEAVLQLSGDIKGLLNLAPRIPSLDFFTSSTVSILVGVLALIGAGRVSSPAWGWVFGKPATCGKVMTNRSSSYLQGSTNHRDLHSIPPRRTKMHLSNRT